MVSTRRSSFSVPALPSSSRKPPRSNRSTISRGETPPPPPLLPPRPPKPPIQRQISSCSTNHFLHNINLDGDLLLIPDPPSPSKRHRRRLSSPLQDLTNSGALSGVFSDDHHNQIKKRQSIGHIPSPRVVCTGSANHATETHLDLSGAAFVAEYERNKVLRRHSVASCPSPMTTSEEFSTSALDLSGAMDFSDFEADPPKDHSRICSPVLRRKMLTERDVEAVDQIEATAPVSVKRRRYSFTLVPSPIPSSAGAISNSGHQLKEALSFRPPRPETSSQRRKKRQSFFVPAPNRGNENDNDRPEPVIDFSGVEGSLLSDPVVHEHSSPSHMDFHLKAQESSIVAKAECTFEVSSRKSPPEECPDFLDETSPSGQESVSKRRKKRQSIYLPSDLENEHRSEVTEFFDTLKKAGNQQRKNNEVLVETSADHNTSLKSTAADGMGTIRRLVREYCSLPEGKRGTSNAARKIEELTRYPLVATPVPAWDGSSQSLLERRHALLVKLGPIVERMDKGKTAEKDICERVTGFRVEKTRNGRYRYLNSETNMRISHKQYEEVYLEQLQKSSEEKGLVIQQFLRDFDMSVHQRRIGEHDSTFGQPCDGTSRNLGETDVNVVGTVEVKSEACELVEDESMDISESQSPRETEGAELSSDANGDDILIESATDATRQVIVHLPPREEIPTNTEIAKAHKELWRSIDDALDTYSRTVLAIQASKESAIQTDSR